MKFSITPLLLAVSLLATSAQAVIVSVNFQGRGQGTGTADLPGAAIAPGDAAGVMNVGNFNNISGAQYSPPDNAQGTGFTFTSPALNSSTGAATAVTFNIMANDSWNSGSGNSTPNHVLMNGIIKSQNNNDATDQQLVPLNILGLTPGNTYTLDLYTTENGGGANFSASNGTQTFYQGAQAGADYLASPGFIKGTNMVAGTTGLPVANYVEFTGVVGANGQINIAHTWLSGSDGSGIAGFQLNVVPEPAGLTLLGLGSLLVFRRRRK